MKDFQGVEIAVGSKVAYVYYAKELDKRKGGGIKFKPQLRSCVVIAVGSMRGKPGFPERFPACQIQYGIPPTHKVVTVTDSTLIAVIG